jgi:hypothetical protein
MNRPIVIKRILLSIENAKKYIDVYKIEYKKEIKSSRDNYCSNTAEKRLCASIQTLNRCNGELLNKQQELISELYQKVEVGTQFDIYDRDLVSYLQEIGIDVPRSIIDAANKNTSTIVTKKKDVSTIILNDGEIGWSYEKIFAGVLREAHWIKIVDPYIRTERQAKNILHLLSLVEKPQECRVKLETWYDSPGKGSNTEEVVRERLEDVTNLLNKKGFSFNFEFIVDIHDRSITTDKFKMQMGRGLDIFYFDGVLKTRACEITILPLD